MSKLASVLKDLGRKLSSAVTTSSNGGRTSGTDPGGSSFTSDPTGSIVLHHILGKGSFGIVHYGTWQGRKVAVKIIKHMDAASTKVQQEVALYTRFRHPNVVGSLHSMSIMSKTPLKSASPQAESLHFTSAPPPTMETWIVLEYCNAGSLASHLERKAAVVSLTTAMTQPLPLADMRDYTALHLASQNGHTEVVEALLRAGADKEAKTYALHTALHLVSEGGRTEVVEALLRAGADKEAKTNAGYTALHLASYWGRTEVVEALLRAGADKEAKTNVGTTPLFLAKKGGKAKLVALLEGWRSK